MLSASAGAGPNAVLAITSHHITCAHAGFQGYRFWELLLETISYQEQVHRF